MRSHCPTWRVETPTNSAISSRVRPSSLQSTAERRWKTRRSWAFRRRSLMSFRCWGVNWIVFITPSHHPHGSDHQGVPPRSPSAIVGSSGLARLYLTGLLTEHPNKNCDTLAQVVPGTSEQRLQGLLTTIDWDEGDLNRQRVERLLTLPTEGDGVVIFDDTGFAKQGKSSVGVARQYSGTLGKTGNCQVTVNCPYAERTIAWPIATRLYLPEQWVDDADRRKRATVPEDIAFRTKPQIALELLDRAQDWGVRWACVVADAD